MLEKRFYAIFLSLCMVLSTTPVYAAEDFLDFSDENTNVVIDMAEEDSFSNTVDDAEQSKSEDDSIISSDIQDEKQDQQTIDPSSDEHLDGEISDVSDGNDSVDESVEIISENADDTPVSEEFSGQDDSEIEEMLDEDVSEESVSMLEDDIPEDVEMDENTVSDNNIPLMRGVLKAPSPNDAKTIADNLISDGYCSSVSHNWIYTPSSDPIGTGYDTGDEGNISYAYYDGGVLVISLTDAEGENTTLGEFSDDVLTEIKSFCEDEDISNIKQVFISDGFTQINENTISAFTGTEYVFMPHSITTIASGALAGLTNLKFMGLSNSIINLGGGCFANCEALEGHLVLPMTIRNASNIMPGSLNVTTITFPYLGCANGNAPFFNNIISGPNKIDTVHLKYDGEEPIAANMPLYMLFSNYTGNKELCHFYVYGKFNSINGAHSITSKDCEIVFMNPENIIRIESGALSSSPKLKGINISEWSNLEYIGVSAFSTSGDITYWKYKNHMPVIDKADVLDLSECLNLRYVDSTAFTNHSIKEFIPPAFEPLTELPDANPYVTGTYKNFTTYYNTRPFSGNKVSMKVDVSHMHGCFASSGLFGSTIGGVINDLYFPEDFGGAHYGGIFGTDIDKDFLGSIISYPVTAMSLNGPYAEGPSYQVFNGTPGMNYPDLEKFIFTAGSDLYGRKGYYNHSDYGFNRGTNKSYCKVVIDDGIYAICGNGTANVDFDFSNNHTLKIYAPGCTKSGDAFDGDFEPICDHTQEGLQSFLGQASTDLAGGGPGDIVFPETLEYIGSRVFAHSNFQNTGKKIYIPANVKYIGEGAFMGHNFSGTDGNGTIDLSQNENLIVIPTHFVTGCPNIKEIKLPPNLKKISSMSLMQLSQYSGDMIIPDSVQIIGDTSFNGTNITGRLRFPEKMPYKSGTINVDGELIDAEPYTVNNVSYSVFSQMMIDTLLINSNYSALDIPVDYLKANTIKSVLSDNLQELTLRKGETGIMDDFNNSESDLFRDLFKHTKFGIIIIKEGVENIGEYAFTGTNVTKVDISENTTLETIGQGAFMDCMNLTDSFTVPDNVHFIGEDAFTNTGISEIHFPVTVLPENGQIRRIFQDCPNLNKFVFTAGSDNPLLHRQKGVWIDLDSPDTWENAPYSKKSGGSIVIERGVQNIGKNALVNADNIATLTMPVDIDIHEDAFNDNFLKNIILMQGNDSNDIPDKDADSYSDNPWMKSKSNTVNIDVKDLVSENRINNTPKLNKIGDYAFYKANNINMNLPSCVTEVGDYSFYQNKAQCLSLYDMSNLKKVGVRAFYECTTLPAVVDLSELASLGMESYYNCPNIDGIYITSKLVDDNLGKDDGSIDYHITNGYAIYDGNETDGGASIVVNDPGYTIKYGLKKYKINSYDMPKFSEVGSHNIFFTISKDDTVHVTGKVILNITEPVDEAEYIEYTVTNGSAHYDGNETDGGAMVEVDESIYPGYTIKYSVNNEDFQYNNIPKYTKAGTYKIYFKITADGYMDTYGNLLITIYKNKSNIHTDVDQVNLYNGRSIKSVKVWTDNGLIRIKSYDDTKVTVSLNKITGATEENPATLTISGVNDAYGQSKVTIVSDYDDLTSNNTKSLSIKYIDSEGEMVTGFDFRNAVKDYLPDGTYDFIFITSTNDTVDYDGNIYTVPSDEADLLDMSTDNGYTIVAFAQGNKVFITAPDMPIKFNEDSSHMFDDLTDYGVNVRKVDFVNTDTSNINNLSGMFMDSGVQEIDFENFDTSGVTNFSYMFSDCDMTEVNLSDLDTSSATDISSMFRRTTNMDAAYDNDECVLDISNVKKINNMFEDSDISEFTAARMFRSSVAGAKVTDASFMFKGCKNLETIDPAGLAMTNVTDIRSMFEDCVLLKDIVIPFSASAVKKGNYENLFKGCISLETLDISKMTNLGADPDGTDMFGTSVDGSDYYRYVITSGWFMDKEYDYHKPQYKDKKAGAPLRLKSIKIPNTSNMKFSGRVRLPFAMKATAHLRTDQTTYVDKEYVIRDINTKITETVYQSSSYPSVKIALDLKTLTADYLQDMNINGEDTLGFVSDKGNISIDDLYYMNIDKATGLTYYAYVDDEGTDCMFITGDATKDLTSWDTKDYNYGGWPYENYMYDYEKTSGVWRKYNYIAYEPEWQVYYSLITKHIGFDGDMHNFCADQLFRSMKAIESITFTDNADIDTVSSAKNMFEGNYLLKTLYLNDTCIMSDEDITGMFKNCSDLEKIYCKYTWIAHKSGTNPKYYEDVFTNCSSLGGYNSNQTDSSYCSVTGGYFTKIED